MSNKPSDSLGGVKCFTIGGRMIEERERCLGMTNEERRWRAQWLKDQVLAHDEPRDVPELYKATTNVFRRLWKTPFWKFQRSLEPLVGKDWAYGIRHYIGKTCTCMLIGYIGVYIYLYNSNDFTDRSSWQVYLARSPMYPDHPDYPNVKQKTKEELVDYGFYSSVLARKIEIPPEVPKPPPKRVRADGSEVVCPPVQKKD